MKIISFNRQYTEQIGGDMVLDLGLQKEFQNGGHTYEISSDYEKDLTDYDVVILWHINWSWSIKVARNAAKYKKPLIVDSIFYEFLDFSMVKEVTECATWIINHSEEERDLMFEKLNLNDEKFAYSGVIRHKSVIIPVTIDPIFERKGVFMAARYEEFKGQLKVIKACKELNIPLTLAGSMPSPMYYLSCQMENYGELLGAVSQKEVKNILADTRVYLHPSQSERGCLSAHEAKAQGCKVIMTENNGANDTLKPDATVNPNDYEEIRDTLKRVYFDYPMTHRDAFKFLEGLMNGTESRRALTSI